MKRRGRNVCIRYTNPIYNNAERRFPIGLPAVFVITIFHLQWRFQLFVWLFYNARVSESCRCVKKKMSNARCLSQPALAARPLWGAAQGDGSNKILGTPFHKMYENVLNRHHRGIRKDTNLIVGRIVKKLKFNESKRGIPEGPDPQHH